MIGFFKNMMKDVADTRQSLVRKDEPSPPPQDKATPITDDEVHRLLKAFDGGYLTSAQITVRSYEREVYGSIEGRIRSATGQPVKIRALRGIFTSSPWQLEVDGRDLALSSNQRKIIAKFMHAKYVDPKVITEADFRKKMGW